MVHRVLLVGCGGISNAWLDALRRRDDVKVVALVDLSESTARTRAEQHGLSDALISTSLGDAIDAKRPDLVIDCTVPEAHAEVALVALGRGCNVYGEKPLAATMDGARSMQKAAAKAGKTCAVMQNRRYDPNVRRLAHLLGSGAIGRVSSVYSRFLLGPHFGGFREQMQHVLLLDMAIHTFDAARFLTRAEPERVLSHEWNPPGSWYRHGASAVAIFEMSGGIVYTYEGSWCAEGMPTSWESTWRIVGSEGSAEWDGAAEIRAERVVLRDGFSSKTEPVCVPAAPEGELRGHAAAIDEFLRALSDGTPPDTRYDDNIKSLSMVHGAIESAAAGRWVTLAAS